MTPNDITVLIHHHVSPEVHPRAHAPAVQDSLRMFVINGILEQKEDSYTTTERGEALVRMICNIGFPQQAWVDKDDNIILRTS